MVAGRAALPQLLADFVQYEFASNARHRAAGSGASRSRPSSPRQDVTVGKALAPLRCRDCGEPPEIPAAACAAARHP
jgi:hypothetical protein